MELFVFLELSRRQNNGHQARQSLLQPPGYWKGVPSIKKLAEAAKPPEETAKRWFIKQALLEIYPLAPSNIPHQKLDVSTPNSVHQADIFFFFHMTWCPASGKSTDTC